MGLDNLPLKHAEFALFRFRSGPLVFSVGRWFGLAGILLTRPYISFEISSYRESTVKFRDWTGERKHPARARPFADSSLTRNQKPQDTLYAANLGSKEM